jgi:hypothetical protein
VSLITHLNVFAALESFNPMLEHSLIILSSWLLISAGPSQDRSPDAAQIFLRETAQSGGLSAGAPEAGDLNPVIAAERGHATPSEPSTQRLASRDVCETSFIFYRIVGMSSSTISARFVRWGGVDGVTVTGAEIRLTGAEPIRFRTTSEATASRVANAMTVLRDHCAVKTSTGF